MFDTSPVPDVPAAALPDHAARVAAEVAARYGVPVSPAVVQQVPRGVSGLPSLQWDGSKLAFQDPDIWRKGVMGGRKRGAGRQGLVNPAVAERRARVAELHAKGFSDARIVEALGLANPGIVQSDRRVLHLRQNYDPSAPKPRTATQVRADRLKVMLAQGWTREAMLAEFGITSRELRSVAQFAGLKLPEAVPRNIQRSQERAALIARMVAEGCSRAEILAATGLSTARAAALAEQKGVALPPPARRSAVVPVARVPRAPRMRAERPAPQRPAHEVRRAAIAVMDLAQMTVADICAALGGADADRVRDDLRALGLRAGKTAKTPAITKRGARLDALRQMDLAGQTIAGLAVAFGVSEVQMRRDLDDIDRRPPPINMMHEKALGLRARIEALCKAGKSRREICSALDIRDSCLRNHLRALGIDLPRADAGRVVTKGEQASDLMQALRARIHALRAAGRTIEQISAAVGRSCGTVSYHLSKPAPASAGAA